MIRRISKNNDLKDIVKSCPIEVIDNIHTLKYYVEGHEDKAIVPSFEKKNNVLVAVLSSQDLKNHPSGILYRKALYSKVDEKYPDHTYDLEMVDCLDVWLGDEMVTPSSTPYLTSDDLKTINGESIVGYGDITVGLDSEQEEKLNEIDQKADKSELVDYAKKSDIPEVPSLDGYATETWVEGKGYLTEHQDLSEYAKKSEIPGPFKTINGISIIGSGNIDVHGGGGGVTIEEVDAEINNKLVGYATESWVEGKGYLTEHQDLTGYATETWVNSQGYARKTQENVYSGTNKFEGTTTYFGNYYNLVSRTYIKQNGDIYDKGTKLEEKYALKTELPTIPTFKTINGESIIGEGNIVIQGGGTELPDYIKTDHIEFSGIEDGYTSLSKGGFVLQGNDYSSEYNGNSFSIWNNDRELGINGGEEGLSSSSGVYGSTWMGAIYMPGGEEPHHYGIQVSDVEGTHVTELNHYAITFWDYNQTTEEGDIDWDNPTLTELSKEELIEVKNINNKVDHSEIWTGTQAE